ncbi:MarR family winged helix-turn-helix transcriptional regulator [Staphylococcus simulans]
MNKEMKEALIKFDMSLMNINKYISDLLHQTKLKHMISREQLEALIMIRSHRRLTINELAELQGIFKTAASKRIHKLEKMGLVTQAASDNKRIKLMEMTEEGIQFLEEVKEKLARVVSEKLKDRFSTQEIVQFVEQLQAIESTLKQR